MMGHYLEEFAVGPLSPRAVSFCRRNPSVIIVKKRASHGATPDYIDGYMFFIMLNDLFDPSTVETVVT